MDTETDLSQVKDLLKVTRMARTKSYLTQVFLSV